MTSHILVAIRDLSVSFGSSVAPLKAVDGISFEVGAGEFFLIIGESGSGKTLTGGALIGLNPPGARVSGSIGFRDQEIIGQSEKAMRRLRGRHIGIVYQNPLSAMNPSWTIGEQIAEPIVIHRLGSRRHAVARAVELLDRVRIPDPHRVARAYPHELSGGMRQRAMIAMALACQPSLLIADEPTTALDVTIKAQILELLSELRREMALTVILITHDMGVVAELADRILVMYAGKIAEIGPAEAVLSHPTHPYTEALMMSGAIAKMPFKAVLPAIPGAAPAIGARAAGCRFSNRCPRTESDCHAAEPILRPVGSAASACFHPLNGAAVAGFVEAVP